MSGDIYLLLLLLCRKSAYLKVVINNGAISASIHVVTEELSPLFCISREFLTVRKCLPLLLVCRRPGKFKGEN